MMRDSEIKNLLKQFGEIKPKKDFTEKSRLFIVSQIPERHKNIESYNNQEQTAHGIKFFILQPTKTLSLVVASIAVLFGVYYSILQISPLLLPGLNKDKIIAEADIINQKIDIEVAQIDHFKNVSIESNSVLNEMRQDSFDHLNKTTIQGEEKSLNTATDTDKELNNEINSMLKELTK